MTRKVHYYSIHIENLECPILIDEFDTHWSSKTKDKLINNTFWPHKYTEPNPITRSCITKVTCIRCLELLSIRVNNQLIRKLEERK